MNRDDVMKMAREAGLHIATDHDWMPIIALTYAQKFAELVAAATLKNSVMTDEEYEQAMADEGQRRMLTFDTEVRAMIKEAVEMEREAIMEICNRHRDPIAGVIHHAIRARGQE
jgi:polysaccharide pyruvyl transferase WcaK-like protein